MSHDNDFQPYYQTGVAEVDHRNIDSAGSDHPFGDEPRPFEADLRYLIKQVADELYDTWQASVREYLANAETACLKVVDYVENPNESPFDQMIVSDSYEPKIVVVWNRAEQKLTIEDNGIGMAAIEVDEIFRQIGRSAARDLGTKSGAFGMGALSFNKFVGSNNTMPMVSHSRLNDDNAAYLVSLAGVEPIIGKLPDEQYGTKFQMTQKDSDMDVRSAVEKYAEWMRVPVLYREIDENGMEVFNEDWGDKRLYDDYKDGKFADSFTIEGSFEAYCSSCADGKTLLLSMPIERNHGKKAGAPYPVDVRLLDESGKVVLSSNGNEGLIPISRPEYNRMLLDARPDYITERLLSQQDVVAYRSNEQDVDYVIDESKIESGEPLPLASYKYLSEVSDDTLCEMEVIIGPHAGRTLVDEGDWESMDKGRAELFVPETELEPFDCKTGDGDLCLPTPTTDRSRLQKNDVFWRFIGQQFAKQFDESIEEGVEMLDMTNDTTEAIRKMNPRSVNNLHNNAK